MGDKQANRLHERATRLVDKANECNRMASQLEEQAAIQAGDAEPARSVLYRSAAELALAAGQVERADKLAQQGLSPNTPPEIERELKDVRARAWASGLITKTREE